MAVEMRRAHKSRGNVTVVLDGQAGSCGKGKVIGYLALRDNPAAAIDNFMSNAGHTFVYNNGDKIVTQHLPTSMVNPDTKLLIGPGAAITPEILISEIRKYESVIANRQIIIHPRAAIIEEKHRDEERRRIRSGTTFKGCGAAQAGKIMRCNDTSLIYDKVAECFPSDVSRYILVADTGSIMNNIIDSGGDVIIEGSQGFDLDINYGLDYPHVTSRQCHAGQLVADCGISPRFIDDIYMVIRPYPIRISNSTDIGCECNSGSYAGSKEITWDIIKDRCGAPDCVEFGEMTTVTKKVRRVFEMNWDRLVYAVKINRPTKICLNFAQYIDYDAMHCTKWVSLPNSVKEFVLRIEKVTGVEVALIGTGPTNRDMVDMNLQSHDNKQGGQINDIQTNDEDKSAKTTISGRYGNRHIIPFNGRVA